MKNKTKDDTPKFKSGFEANEVSAIINGIKHKFTNDKIFMTGIELK